MHFVKAQPLAIEKAAVRLSRTSIEVEKKYNYLSFLSNLYLQGNLDNMF